METEDLNYLNPSDPYKTNAKLIKQKQHVLSKKLSLDVENKKREANRREYQLKKKKARKDKKEFHFISPEAMVRRDQRKLVTDRRVDALVDNPTIEKKITKDIANIDQASQSLLLVIRIRGAKDASAKSLRVLRTIRVDNVHGAAFLKPTAENLKCLNMVKNFVTWGYPTEETVSLLIRGRGYAMINNKRTLLNDNRLIEKAIGNETGCICLEDIIHELHTVGTNFDAVNEFLTPFHLTHPPQGFHNFTRRFSRGGDYGFRGDKINELVTGMV